MEVKNAQRFAEVEYCLQHYFDSNIRPVMQSVRQQLTDKQSEELAEHETSTRGLMAQFSKSMTSDTFYNTKDSLSATAKWNSKTAEDYVDMCKESIVKSQSIRKDIVRFADEWRETVVAEIGKQRYVELSKQMGCDLALAYTDYRFEQMMIDYMAKQEMPKSSFDYIMRKGTEGSLLGLGTTMNRSELQREIDKRAEANYKPTTLERGVGHAVSVGADIVATGGTSSWSTIVNMAGAEVIFSGIDSYLEKKASAEKSLTVEECISKGVFGSNGNVFDSFRKKGKSIASYDNEYVKSFNDKLDNKMAILKNKPTQVDWDSVMKRNQPAMSTINKPTEKRDCDIPLIIKDDKVNEYMTLQKEVKQKKIETATNESELYDESTNSTYSIESTEQQSANEQQPTNENGWGNLLSSIGLDNISDVGANLGYVIAMLPDMISGLFTGKNQSFNIKSSMLPLASILMGMFIKNPLLRMMLVGLGGANLLNKAGHEALERQDVTQQYKKYNDESLNSRITNPVIQGNCLVATIDRVPCSVTLPQNVVNAYNSGALPLNTLANAILAKSDNMKQIAQSNYQSIDMQQSNDRQLTMK